MIEGVAIKYKGTLYDLPRPNRHCHVIAMIARETGDRPISGEQGFVDGDGKFLDRIVGAAYAIDCGQIEKLNWPPRLYSEDLW